MQLRITGLGHPHSRFAWASTTRSSARAAHALRSLIALTPMPIRYVLADWLVFYNTERPHQALALLSPVQSLMINQPECHMLWTCTRT